MGWDLCFYLQSYCLTEGPRLPFSLFHPLVNDSSLVLTFISLRRPFLLQSDLPSVSWKMVLLARSDELLPRKCAKLLFLASETTWTFLQDLSRPVSRFSRCLVTGSHLRHFSDPTGSNTITIRHLEKRETALDRSWRKSKSS